MEQELSTILVQTSSLPLSRDRVAPVFSGVRVTRSVVLCVCFVDCCLSFWPLSSSSYGASLFPLYFSVSHCIVLRILITLFGIYKLFLTFN